ncbi:hypothetical protein K450DRAFT_221194 [Umbelopsis ramanniana AG]|uniref:Uncharacterized protein n=1 Tax=Umbelopsis ramanniana AG TaxID=1314678 RepID=A0AAD5EKF9_UMBRA|nr:uncharacterized protein K450DRAFT_221194 [Umbelopsis ramanniana AG]KAI8584035.1 hypothetical protein K450DRAFT_221194 [Umbelopsis ramanniana AG]
MEPYQYDSNAADAYWISLLYGDWATLEKKPCKEEVGLVLSFAKKIDGPALVAISELRTVITSQNSDRSNGRLGSLDEVLALDREFWPSRTGQNQAWSQASVPSKVERLRAQVLKFYAGSDISRQNDDETLNTLCTNTLFEFVVGLFKGTVSLPMFRLYYTSLPRYKSIMQELYKSSYGIDRDREWFVRPLEFNHYFDDTTVDWNFFRGEVSLLPKLNDIVRVLSLSVKEKGSRSSVAPGSIIFIKGYLRQWRIFKKQLERDRQMLSYYGAWLYIWDALVVKEQDFQMAVKHGLLDNRDAFGTGYYTYDNFERLVRSYRTRPDAVEESIYQFVRNLNEEYYIANKFLQKPNLEDEVWFSKIGIFHPSIHMNDRRRKESIERAQWAYSVASMHSNNKFALPFIGSVINRGNADGGLEQFLNPVQRFQAAIILCERNYPNTIQAIQNCHSALKSNNSKDAVKYADDCLTGLLDSFKVIYDNHSSPGESVIEWEELNHTTNKTYMTLKMPTVYKLKKADFFISAQFPTDYNIREPVMINVDEISMFPLRREALQWCSMHLEGNMYFEHLKQLYLHMIPDKESFTIADDDLILQGFTWDQWRSLLTEKESTMQVPLYVLHNCEKVLRSFHSFWGNLKRDMSTKQIYDPATLYIGIFGAILATTQMFSMIIAIIQVLQASNIIHPVSPAAAS